MSFNYAIKSDMPRGRYFLTLFLFCRVPGTDNDEYCGIDTTGPLDALAKRGDVAKRRVDNDEDLDAFYARQETSDSFAFKTTVIDSRPTELVVCVVILSCVSVSMLVLYFVYERSLKKTV